MKKIQPVKLNLKRCIIADADAARRGGAVNRDSRNLSISAVLSYSFQQTPLRGRIGIVTQNSSIYLEGFAFERYSGTAERRPLAHAIHSCLTDK